MRLQYHVVSQKMAQALAEAGVRQKARYFWVGDAILPSDAVVLPFTKNAYAAFDVAELGWMLPFKWAFETSVWEDGVVISTIINDAVCEFQAQTEAGARARMILRLIETKFLEPKDAIAALGKGRLGTKP